MRLLFLLHAHPALQAGGTEIFSQELFRALRNDGHEGLFVAGTAAHQRPPSPGTAFQAAGTEPDELLLWTGGFDPFNLAQVDTYGLSAAFSELLSTQSPDIIHFHHVLTLGVETIGLVRRLVPTARLIFTLHDYYPICANDGQMVTTEGALCSSAGLDKCRACFPDRTLTDLRLRDLHIRGALSQIDHFISPSRFLRDRYVAWGLPSDRISVVPNGLPTVAPVAARRTLRRDRFAFLGHINRFKGGTVALEASSILSGRGVEHSLSLHGSTAHQTESTVSRFRDACDRAPDARYRGPYQRTDLPRLIAPNDWVLFPSEWWENAPLVINEAFQHWRPVICSDIGGAAELVQHEVNGLTFPVGDPRALADAMQRAIEEPGLWQHLVDGITAPFTIEEAAKRHNSLYQTLLNKPNSRMAA